MSRAVHAGYLGKVCRGLYIDKRVGQSGLVLFHAAALLRANEFNYISLETALSDAGVISQIPINRISIMSSGRSNVIFCGSLGTIEFVHTNQKPNQLIEQLHSSESIDGKVVNKNNNSGGGSSLSPSPGRGVNQQQ